MLESFNERGYCKHCLAGSRVLQAELRLWNLQSNSERSNHYVSKTQSPPKGCARVTSLRSASASPLPRSSSSSSSTPRSSGVRLRASRASHHARGLRRACAGLACSASVTPGRIKAYKAFSRRFKGIDALLHRFVNDFVIAGASNGEAAKQIFVAIGGKGSGKSQFFNALKRLVRKAEPVPYNHGCPVHDNPLSLLYMIPTLAERKIDSEDAFDDYLARIAEIKLEILESLGWVS